MGRGPFLLNTLEKNFQGDQKWETIEKQIEFLTRNKILTPPAAIRRVAQGGVLWHSFFRNVAYFYDRTGNPFPVRKIDLGFCPVNNENKICLFIIIESVVDEQKPLFIDHPGKRFPGWSTGKLNFMAVALRSFLLNHNSNKVQPTTFFWKTLSSKSNGHLSLHDKFFINFKSFSFAFC